MMIMMTISISGLFVGIIISRPISTLIRIRSDGSSRYRAAARFLVVVVSEVRKGLRHLSNTHPTLPFEVIISRIIPVKFPEPATPGNREPA